MLSAGSSRIWKRCARRCRPSETSSSRTWSPGWSVSPGHCGRSSARRWICIRRIVVGVARAALLQLKDAQTARVSAHPSSVDALRQHLAAASRRSIRDLYPCHSLVSPGGCVIDSDRGASMRAWRRRWSGSPQRFRRRHRMIADGRPMPETPGFLGDEGREGRGRAGYPHGSALEARCPKSIYRPI